MSKFMKMEENLPVEPTVSKFFSNNECTTESNFTCDRLSDAENCPEEKENETAGSEMSGNETDDCEIPYCDDLPLETVLIEEQTEINIELLDAKLEEVNFLMFLFNIS